MLAALIASRITGRYDFTFAPIALPTPLVVLLLPTLWSDVAVFLTPEELKKQGLVVPSPGEGMSWVCIEAGQQINTGLGGVPGGKRTFYEAKLEIPFLRHPHATAKPFTYKSTMLFSSHLMALSSQHVTGLRSHQALFAVGEARYAAGGWLSVREDKEASVPEEQRWSEELVRAVATGWWVGENTEEVATKFIMETLSPPSPRPHLRIRLHLPSFTQLPKEAVAMLVGNLEGRPLDAEGWLEMPAAGFQLSESTRMEAAELSSV
ncbi:hypothetical protein JCM21900_002242 [Sporobolomyces salmonicolor]